MPKSIRKSNTAPNVSFQKEFFSDLSTPGMLYGATVRSPAGEGTVAAVKPPELPEGYFLFTAGDIPGKNLIETPAGKIPLFCDGRVSYLGEPLGIIVGPDEKTARSLAESTMVVFAEAEGAEDGAKESGVEPPLIMAQRSVRWGPCFKKDADGNIPGLQQAFYEAERIVQNCWTYSVAPRDSGEPNGALCTWFSSPDGNSLTVFTPSQWLSNLRKTISTVLGIKGSMITVKKTQALNTGTNSIWYNSFIACQASLASMLTGKSVRIIYTRDEQERFLSTTLPVTIAHKTAVAKDGRITAMQINIEADAGFATPFAQEIVDRLVIAACGCYAPENISITATALRSESPATNMDISLMDTAAFFAVENQMGSICKETGISPLELRLRNMEAYSSAAKRKAPFMPFSFQLEKTAPALKTIAIKGDFSRHYVSYRLNGMELGGLTGEGSFMAQSGSPRRGIGFACAFEGSCYYGSEVYGGEQSMEVTLEESGGITIHCPPVSDSIRNIFERMAGETLGISPSNVKINSEFSAEDVPLQDTVFCNVSIMTVLLKKCLESIRRRKPDSALPYTVKKKTGNAGKNSWSMTDFEGTPFHSTSFAACTMEVELDPCTFREKIRNIYIIVSAGKLLHTQSAESAIKLGTQRVLGSLVKDELLSCENIHIMFIQSELNPMQIGGLVHNIIPAAYTQALSQAMSCTINSLPLESDSLYELLSQRRLEILAKQKSEAAQNENPGNA